MTMSAKNQPSETVLFLAGSISIRQLHPRYSCVIEKAVGRNIQILVGDANGADRAIQTVLAGAGATKVTVYCSGNRPRNNIGGWPLRQVVSDAAPGTRAFYTAKDRVMAADATHGLMIWDSVSTGTLANIVALLQRGGKTTTFLTSTGRFALVDGVSALTSILATMSDAARRAAEDKIQISSRLSEIGKGNLRPPHSVP